MLLNIWQILVKCELSCKDQADMEGRTGVIHSRMLGFEL